MRYRALIRNTRPFIIKVDTRLVNPLNTQFTIPFPSGFDFKCRVNWGDGNFTTVLAGGIPELTHNYSTPGEYEISVKGRFDQIKFDNSGDRLLLKEIKQWGDNNWRYLSSAFYGCSNMNITATDTPNLTLVYNLANSFRACTSLNTTNLNNWNVSNVDNFSAMFLGSTQFNGNLSSWNVSKGTNFSAMFQGALSFTNAGQPLTWTLNTSPSASVNLTSMFRAINSNIDVSSWNTSRVTNTAFMFYLNNGFNRNLGGWDMSNVNNPEGMFWNAGTFNNGGSNSINGWNMISATKMNQMFRGAVAFNQPIHSWDIRNVSNFIDFMFGKSSANYNATYLDDIYNTWSTLPVQSGVGVVNFGTIKYTASGQPGKNILTGTYGWSITDGGI